MEAKNEEGTYEHPVRYPEVSRDDPDRRQKLAEQREKFVKDADAGKVCVISDLFISHGL